MGMYWECGVKGVEHKFRGILEVWFLSPVAIEIPDTLLHLASEWPRSRYCL